MATVQKEIRKNLRGYNRKDEQILFRLSAKEKTEIRKAAKSLGLNISRYMLGLHRFAVGKGTEDVG